MKAKLEKPMLFSGNFKSDFRGKVYFNNNIVLSKIKRFYIVENKRAKFIRAWHGHKYEAKFIICLRGRARISAVKIQNYKIPSKKIKPQFWDIGQTKPDVVFIPPGYANGSMSLTKDMKLIVFSTSSLNQSLKDDHRYPEEYWEYKK